jgi:hypothetical protein
MCEMSVRAVVDLSAMGAELNPRMAARKAELFFGGFRTRIHTFAPETGLCRYRDRFAQRAGAQRQTLLPSRSREDFLE